MSSRAFFAQRDAKRLVTYAINGYPAHPPRLFLAAILKPLLDGRLAFRVVLKGERAGVENVMGMDAIPGKAELLVI